MAKNCDACQTSNAVVYCRADAAYLCKECDGNVHGANKLASRHERVWLCEVCEQAPAAVTCKADAAALCIACDVEIHSANSLASRHERIPITPLYDCLEVASVAAVVPSALAYESLDEQECSFLVKDDGDTGSEAEAASWLSPNSKPPNASSKDRVAVKRNLLSLEKDAYSKHQEKPKKICRLPNSETFLDIDPYLDLEYVSATNAPTKIVADSLVPVHAPEGFEHVSPSTSDALSSLKVDGIRKGEKSPCMPVFTYRMYPSSMDTGVVPDANTSDLSTKQANSQEFNDPRTPPVPHANAVEPTEAREARVLRYKEKRKNRNFEKTIRYASRKAYAETRPRVKGRFAKRDNAISEQMHEGIPDFGFGIVPSL